MKYVERLLIAVLFITALASAETITLQQGVGGYAGCEDSYIESKNVDGYNGFEANYGNDQFFAAANTRYASW